MSKLLYEVGNLYSGRPYVVIKTKVFGSYEIHGPYTTENEANTAAHDLAEEMLPGEARGVAQIDLLPAQDRKIVRSKFGLQYQPV